jgi:orotate phosphoribosyltransferase-like protein
MAHELWQKAIYNPKIMAIKAEELALVVADDAKKYKIGTIAVRGVSGISIGSVVSYLTKIPLCVIRKEKEDKHSFYNVEYNDDLISSFNYCIIDDLIDSGNTIESIIAKMKETDNRFNLIRIYLYRDIRRKMRGNYKANDGTLYPFYRCDKRRGQ